MRCVLVGCDDALAAAGEARRSAAGRGGDRVGCWRGHVGSYNYTVR